MQEMGTFARFEEVQRVWEGHQGTGSVATRFRLFSDAWDILKNHPIAGVGLNNFLVFSRGWVAHSEYTEVAADTGSVGFLLYFSIFAVMWWRARKIAKRSSDPTQVAIAGLVRAMLLAVLLMDLGRWNSYNKLAWIVFGSFIGYTNSVWQQFRRARWQAAETSPGPANAAEDYGPNLEPCAQPGAPGQQGP
jgi:O-antigen ligase